MWLICLILICRPSLICPDVNFCKPHSIWSFDILFHRECSMMMKDDWSEAKVWCNSPAICDNVQFLLQNPWINAKCHHLLVIIVITKIFKCQLHLIFKFKLLNFDFGFLPKYAFEILISAQYPNLYSTSLTHDIILPTNNNPAHRS